MKRSVAGLCEIVKVSGAHRGDVTAAAEGRQSSLPSLSLLCRLLFPPHRRRARTHAVTAAFLHSAVPRPRLAIVPRLPCFRDPCIVVEGKFAVRLGLNSSPYCERHGKRNSCCTHRRGLGKPRCGCSSVWSVCARLTRSRSERAIVARAAAPLLSSVIYFGAEGKFEKRKGDRRRGWKERENEGKLIRLL